MLRFTVGLALVAMLSACTGVPATTIGSQIDRPVLTADAIGSSAVGDALDSVVADVSARIGDPDTDTGWIAPDSEVYGSCPGEALRVLGWGSLYAIFTSDQEFPATDSSGSLSSWTYGFDHATTLAGSDPRQLGLSTAEGVGLGTSTAEARELYGDRLVEDGDATVDVWGFTIDPGADAHLAGRLSGPTEQDVVTFLERIPGCSAAP